MLESMADGILDFVEEKVSLMKRNIDQISKPSPILPYPKMIEMDTLCQEDLSRDIEIKDAWVLSYFEKNNLNPSTVNIAKKGTNLELIG